MITRLFLPDVWQGYYVLPKHIIGFDIGKTHITATKVVAHRRRITIESTVNHQLAQTGADYHTRASHAIASIIKTMGACDEIRTTLSSFGVVFKEITLPFTAKEKIDLVLGFEVESLLPFPLEQAVVDGIITSRNDAEGKATVLVAAVQKNILAEHIALFTEAGVEPDIVSIDLFSFYGLLKETAQYQSLADQHYLVAIIGFSNTRIASIYQGQLKLIRVIPKGVTSLVKSISTSMRISIQEAHELVLRFGFEKTDNAAYLQAAQQALDDFIKPLLFTMQTFSQQLNQPAQRIILIGGGAEIKNIAASMSQQLGVDTQLFNTNALVEQDRIVVKEQHQLPLSAVLSISTALPTEVHATFNLRRHEFSRTDTTFFRNSIITAASLMAILFAALIGTSYWRISSFNNSIASSEKQISVLLEQTLGITKVKRIDDGIEEARRRVEEQERTWFSFAAQTRASFLNHLQTLSRAIDKQSIALQLKKLLLTHDIIRMQGEVKDIPALITLEEELRQANLGMLTSPQEPKFTITITLKKNTAEGA